MLVMLKVYEKYKKLFKKNIFQKTKYYEKQKIIKLDIPKRNSKISEF